MGNPTDTLQFNCAGCGKLVHARMDQGGRSYPCPKCGAVVQVPKVTLSPRTPSPPVPAGTDLHINSHAVQPPRQRKLAWVKAPTTVTEFVIIIAVGWLGVSLL